MYLKIVNALNLNSHAFASPDVTLLECDEISYARFFPTAKSDFDQVMAEYNTEESIRGYEVLGSEPKFDKKDGFIPCIVLGLSTFHAGSAVPSVRTIVAANQDVFIMNNEGKTIDRINS